MNNPQRSTTTNSYETATVNKTGQRVILTPYRLGSGVWQGITPFTWLSETQQQAYALPEGYRPVLMLLLSDDEITRDGHTVEVREVVERTPAKYLMWNTERRIVYVDGVEVADFTTSWKNAV